MEQLKGGQTMCACAHLICLPPFLPADFKEQAGRQAELKVFTIMCATHLSLYDPVPGTCSQGSRHCHRAPRRPVTEVETERQPSADAQRSLACSSIAHQVFFLAPVYVCRPRCLIESRKEKTRGSARTGSGKTWRALVPQCCPSRLSWTPKSHWEGI